MADLISNTNREEFFGAVTKNFKALVGNTKREVKTQIAERGIAKRNVVLFRCRSNGKNKIKQKILDIPSFKLNPTHYRVLRKACFDFLENSD